MTFPCRRGPLVTPMGTQNSSDCHYGSRKATTEHLGRVAIILLTSFRGQPPLSCGSTGSAWIYKSGVAGILPTFPLLTFAIEIPVEHFFKTVAFLNRGRSFPVVMQTKSGFARRDTESPYDT
jgi:hypothetical protein